MEILKNINEAFSVDNLAKMFYSGYRQVSPGRTRVEQVPFLAQMGQRYNASIADAFTGQDPRTNALANVLATIYTQTYNTKKDLFEMYRSVKDLDQASVIINDFIDDAFNTPDSDFPFTIKLTGDIYEKSGIEQILEDFVKKFDLYELDAEINEPYLVYGDYYITTIPEIGKGIIDISDNVDIENVFSIYKNGSLIQHIGMNSDAMFAGAAVNGYVGQLKPIHPDLLTHFTLSARKINIKLPIKDYSIWGLPESIKLGRGVLYDALALLKKYQLLDAALTYKEVRNALMPILLGVTTGAFTTPDHMIEACKTIEDYLQDGTAMSFDLQDSNTLTDLLQASSGVKVAPIPGDKGQLSRIDVGQGTNETDGLNNILNGTGSRIATTTGGVTQSEAGKSRLEILKSNSRRSKKLIEIQKGKSRGWQGLFHKHLKYQHINIERESIQVQYKSIPNADIFEEANGLVTLLSVVNDLQTFADSVNQSNSGYKVNAQKMIDAFNLFIGNRYKVMKDFLEIEAVKKELPGANAAFSTYGSSQTSTIQPAQPDQPEPQGPELKTASQSSTALTKMNKSFDGSSGSSDAVGQ